MWNELHPTHSKSETITARNGLTFRPLPLIQSLMG